jgi:hypothetical protein
MFGAANAVPAMAAANARRILVLVSIVVFMCFEALCFEA